MNTEILKQCGLTHSETSAYLALIELNKATTGKIVDKAEIAMGKAYLVMNSLVQKGLATYIIEAGKKHYIAKHPSTLLEQAQERVQELKSILPALTKIFEKNYEEPSAEVFEGMKGLNSYYNFMFKQLKRGDTVLVIGVSKEGTAPLEGFYIALNKRREKLGIKMKIIFNHDAKRFGRQREKVKGTEVRYMKPEMETPSWTEIFGDYVGTVNSYSRPIGVIIKEKGAADSYREYFNMIWDSCVE